VTSTAVPTTLGAAVKAACEVGVLSATMAEINVATAIPTANVDPLLCDFIFVDLVRLTARGSLAAAADGRFKRPRGRPAAGKCSRS
jgi:hypothetical protein